MVLSRWWNNDLPRWVKVAFFVLLINGLPAFLILMTVPHLTDILFVWTINGTINGRLIGVMYGNALLLVLFGMLQPSWARARVIMVVIMLFSVLATLLTFFFLPPFLAHPWYHLAYWLSMYAVLYFLAPIVFTVQELQVGGRLPVTQPLSCAARALLGIAALISFVISLGLVFQVELVNRVWPWTMPPLVAALIGVLFFTHAAAYTWAIWDGDWLRTRPIFWQAPPTALLFLLLPAVHFRQLRESPWLGLGLYLLIAGFYLASFSLMIFIQGRAARRAQTNG